ncbi:hypothetical protein G6F56_010431 [Rhizopus delemar]|nr:hypothetical protein G6F56_010431 [Rhizopus delemar]
MLARGESKRKMQLPDLFLIELLNEGPTPFWALIATMSEGKTNQHDRIGYGSVIRHLDVESCPIGAMTLYFFSRFELKGESFPDFSRRQNWYEIHVFKGKDRLKEMAYRTQHQAYKRALENVGINSSKVTHINRGSALNLIDEESVSDNQQRRVGRWGKDRMVGCYLSSLPKQSMRAIAGFTSTAGNSFFGACNFNPSGRAPDSVVLQNKYPGLAIWNNDLFRSKSFLSYKRQILESMPPIDESVPISMQVERIVPQMSAAIRTSYTSIGSEIRALKAEMRQNMETYQNDSRRETRQHIFGFFRQGLNYCSQLESVTASSSQNLQTNNVTEPLFANGDTTANDNISFPIAPIPVYHLDRTLKTVDEVWKEYSVGIKRGPAVEMLELEHGTLWRKDRTEARYFGRRNVIYKEIKRMANELNISNEEAAGNIERTRQRLKKTLDGLREMIAATTR